jgi:sec-independent protein translocase protein TatA
MITLAVILGVIGPWQIVLIVAIVLIFFGGRKIPELMKGMGKGIRSFKDGMEGKDEKEDNTEVSKKE